MTRNLTNATGGIYPWGSFKTDQQLGVQHTVAGNAGSYNYGGYMLVLGDDNTSQEDVFSRISNLDKFITDNTVAFNFVMSGYVLDIDYFYSLDFLLERVTTGGFQPVVLSYQIFKPSLSWNYSFNLAGDIIIYILTVVLVSVNVRAVVPHSLVTAQVENK